jgi:hypothetical protein
MTLASDLLQLSTETDSDERRDKPFVRCLDAVMTMLRLKLQV